MTVKYLDTECGHCGIAIQRSWVAIQQSRLTKVPHRCFDCKKLRKAEAYMKRRDAGKIAPRVKK